MWLDTYEIIMFFDRMMKINSIDFIVLMVYAYSHMHAHMKRSHPGVVTQDMEQKVSDLPKEHVLLPLLILNIS